MYSLILEVDASLDLEYNRANRSSTDCLCMDQWLGNELHDIT